MNLKQQKPELLAPAGNMTMLNAVLNAGADAVYLGIEKLNMRATAANFTSEMLPEVVTLCHGKNAEVHLTVNSIVMEGEISELDGVMQAAKAAGVDLIICWDTAVIQKCLEYEMPFCISTQASISNSGSARFYKNLGAKRIVLARECTLDEIIKIKENVDIEIETFIHGAMCVAVSGRCFMSHELFGRSANQGDCMQPCRREYEIYDGKKDYSLILGKDYVMSAKDMNTLPFIEKLIEAGIRSFKIEGRKRSPEYAAKVTSVYRRAIDAYFEGTLTEEMKSSLGEELLTVYNRGYSNGFYLGQPDGGDISKAAGSESEFQKQYLGKVLNYYKSPKIAYIQVEAGQIASGDTLLFIGETTGVVEATVGEMRINETVGSSAMKGDLVTFHLEERVREGDKVYILREK
ncbi:MAG: U32 family peptidase [Ignavibacteriaceae bacterium]|nr:U32 family peptidase [Ignavibacteriaceae bacterium]